MAPDAGRKRKRQCYAYLGGGQLSTASTTLLYTIVVKVKTWHMGACVIAACTLLNRVSDGWHRVAFDTDLFIAADDAIADEDMLEAMLMDNEGDGAPLPPPADKAIAFRDVCDAVTRKSADAVGFSNQAYGCSAVEIWRRWATHTASLAPVETASGDQPRGGCQPAGGKGGGRRQGGGWQPSGWQQGGGWQRGGGWQGGGSSSWQ